MRKNIYKGFTLIECVVSMAIIVIMSVRFYSLILYANASFKRSVAVNVAVRQIDNVLTVFEGCSFKSVGGAGTSSGVVDDAGGNVPPDGEPDEHGIVLVHVGALRGSILR